MKIFHKRKQYNGILAKEAEVMELSKEIAPDKEEFLKDVRMKYALQLLQDKNCIVFIEIVKKYQLTIAEQYDYNAFECFYVQFEYPQAREIVDRRLKDPTGKDRILWLYRLEQLMVKNLNYEQLIPVVNELWDLMERQNVKEVQYQETLYDMFNAYVRLKDEDNIIKTGERLAEVFDEDARNMRVYKKIIQIAGARQDDTMIANYAKRLLDLAALHNSYLESPWVDYELYKAYVNLNRFEEALGVLENLDKQRSQLPKIDLAKLRYFQSNIHQKIGRS